MKTISVRIEDEIKIALDKKLKEEDLTISQVLRKAIKDYLQQDSKLC